MIKAIDTPYRGHLFRSRLEARWAVFFDALRIKWEYEPEGYDLGDGVKYLPDFYWTEENIYIEIKPSNFNIEYSPKDVEKYTRFGKYKTLLLIIGSPMANFPIMGDTRTHYIDYSVYMYGSNSCVGPFIFSTGRRNEYSLYLQKVDDLYGEFQIVDNDEREEKETMVASPLLTVAYQLASSQRFGVYE